MPQSWQPLCYSRGNRCATVVAYAIVMVGG